MWKKNLEKRWITFIHELSQVDAYKKKSSVSFKKVLKKRENMNKILLDTKRNLTGKLTFTLNLINFFNQQRF